MPDGALGSSECRHLLAGNVLYLEHHNAIRNEEWQHVRSLLTASRDKRQLDSLSVDVFHPI